MEKSKWPPCFQIGEDVYFPGDGTTAGLTLKNTRLVEQILDDCVIVSLPWSVVGYGQEHGFMLSLAGLGRKDVSIWCVPEE